MSQMRKRTRHELESENHRLRDQLLKLMRVLREERQLLMRHGPEKAFDAFEKHLTESLEVIGR